MSRTKAQSSTCPASCPGRTHDFTLVLEGVAEITDDLADAIYGVCDDSSLLVRGGVNLLGFDREAGSLEEAIRTAIADIARAAPALRVARVEPDALVLASEAAGRAGCSREAIRLYANGTRGPGGFPAPVSGSTRRSPLYRWTEVASWLLAARGEPPDPEAAARLADARTIATFNAALELRSRIPRLDDAIAFLRAPGLYGEAIEGVTKAASPVPRRRRAAEARRPSKGH